MQAKYNKAVPLYYQVEEYIKEKITSKEWPANYKLPSEPDLAVQLNVSRATIRQAIHELAEENLLIRRHGKGTFVAEGIYEGDFIKAYFPVELGKYHELLSFTREKADKRVAKPLCLQEGDPVYTIFRVRYLEGSKEPSVLEKSFVSAEDYPELERFDLNGNVRLYDVLSDAYGMRLDTFVTELQATVMTEREAAILKCKKGVPALLMTRICLAADEKPIVLTRSILRPDKCKLVVRDKL